MRDSSIINVSLGAQRTMTLRTKKTSTFDSTSSSRQTQKITLPHNSVFVLGPKTNARWLHGIRADKRPWSEKSEPEKAFDGERISLTFRHIGTFIDTEKTKIWGQGARGKTKEQAGDILVGGEAMDAMVIAFGKENHETEFDWDKHYGAGFDAVDLLPDKAVSVVTDQMGKVSEGAKEKEEARKEQAKEIEVEKPKMPEA